MNNVRQGILQRKNVQATYKNQTSFVNLYLNKQANRMIISQKNNRNFLKNNKLYKISQSIVGLLMMEPLMKKNHFSI